jgi:hypothetical protein
MLSLRVSEFCRNSCNLLSADTSGQTWMIIGISISKAGG